MRREHRGSQLVTVSARHPGRRRWVLALLAAVLAVGVGLFAAGPASALTAPAAQNGVGASTSAAQVVVGASAGVVAGQRLGNDLPQPGIVVATGVATNTAGNAARSVVTSTDVVSSPSALRGLTASQVDDLARNAGYEVRPGNPGAANPATRYYAPGTNRSTGFRVRSLTRFRGHLV